MVNPEYTEPGYLCPSDSDAVQAAASDFAGPGDREKALAMFEWVRDGYIWDMRKIIGAEKLLESGNDLAMSFDKSNLLVALLRSEGIPARFNFIKCTFYNEYRDRVDDSVHAPVEIHIDGEWVTADPAFGKSTRKFKSVSEFGEKTWEELKSSKKLAELPKGFVLGYNYLMRFVHPDIRRIRKELRECQEF